MTKKIAVITGGGSGIGAAAAVALAEDGYHVVVAGRRVEKLEEVAARTGGTAIRLDVTDDASVEKFAAQVRELGNVDVLVNNAGGAHGLDTLREANLEDWQVMYDTNVLGVVRVTKALLPLIDAAEGLIINIGSMASFTAYPGGSGYNAAKFGLRALTRAFRMEEVSNPIRITEIDPGRVATDFSLVRFKGDAAKADAVYADKLNLTAGDIAEAIRWVASLPKHMNIDTMNIMPRDQA
ncbi:MAG TPA: SDR family NAD(P)-dependent oxidoreductase [Corynebacterium pollutisoli]|jgi:NADP-dependent 3-hydroxy acid dehydrogenase YdfG|uniref:SDR family NAD(P)-dependent oxidoreductase n=1 Tax=Corynebacterium pollutisoli TaxID=1610489 RepID=A0A7X8RH58_9CORY|nr:SDR family NAD(P)-dependent oxidoreductase [Corynebacterium pollutisoli]HJD78557.1 SDR family NAD(P)-dependent oxidoreductase [Corynebacterium pollutisoli]